MKSAQEVKYNLENFSCPRYEDFPLFDLYMDQVILFINKAMEPLNFEGPENRTITNSMINNYVKNSIVKPPVKKHYKSYHLAYLIMVCILKRVYSLSQIQQLIKIYSDIEDKNRINRDFNKFIFVFEDCLKEVMATGRMTKIYFESPTLEQELMIDVINTIVYKIYVEYKLLAFTETDHEKKDD